MPRKSPTTKKPLPRLASDEAAEAFVTNSDLTEYDLSGMTVVRVEFQPKTERVNMRLPRPLLDAVKASARTAGIPYQRYIRRALELAVEGSNTAKSGLGDATPNRRRVQSK
jgi:predicted DNA binding CopG/RHH family protein